MEIETITASYTYKVNHALYGGAAYESSDHFVSLNATLEAGEDPLEATKDLQKTAKELVIKEVGRTITGFSGGQPQQDFEKLLYNTAAQRPIDEDLYTAKRSAWQQWIYDVVRRGTNTNKSDNRPKK